MLTAVPLCGSIRASCCGDGQADLFGGMSMIRGGSSAERAVSLGTLGMVQRSQTAHGQCAAQLLVPALHQAFDGVEWRRGWRVQPLEIRVRLKAERRRRRWIVKRGSHPLGRLCAWRSRNASWVLLRHKPDLASPSPQQHIQGPLLLAACAPSAYMRALHASLPCATVARARHAPGSAQHYGRRDTTSIR